MTHSIPFGEKMENPEDEPKYRVSPMLLVTSEHIISDSSSTPSPFSSSSGVPDSRLAVPSFESLVGSGEVSELCGVEVVSCWAPDSKDGDDGFDGAAREVCRDFCFSASFFSSVPRSSSPFSSLSSKPGGGEL